MLKFTDALNLRFATPGLLSKMDFWRVEKIRACFMTNVTENSWGLQREHNLLPLKRPEWKRKLLIFNFSFISPLPYTGHGAHRAGNRSSLPFCFWSAEKRILKHLPPIPPKRSCTYCSCRVGLDLAWDSHDAVFITALFNDLMFCLQASANRKRVENIAKKKLDSLIKESKIRDCEDPNNFTVSTLLSTGKAGLKSDSKKVNLCLIVLVFH